MGLLHINRRRFLEGSAASLVAAGASGRIAYAAGVTIGIVYVGPRDDFGWNQAHAVAAKALKELSGITVVEEENVPETDACAKAMESMVNLDGANIILGTSFGYFDPFMVDLSKKYAKVQFRHAAPLWTPALPANLGSYFGYLNQAHYVDGVAAGLSTKSNKLGFVAAKPIASVLSNINSFMLGAKTTNPNSSVQVIFTGDWSLPVREAEATKKEGARAQRRAARVADVNAAKEHMAKSRGVNPEDISDKEAHQAVKAKNDAQEAKEMESWDRRKEAQKMTEDTLQRLTKSPDQAIPKTKV